VLCGFTPDYIFTAQALQMADSQISCVYLGRKPLGHLGMSRGDGRFT
jgi:hypothetical protein